VFEPSKKLGAFPPAHPMVRTHEKRIHHTIAVLVASWLLLAPPLRYGYVPEIEVSTPITRWYLIGRFDSADSCGRARQFRITNAFNSLTSARKTLRRERRRRLLLWAYLWECEPGGAAGSSG